MQIVEDEFRTKLAVVYDSDIDELPVEVDVLAIYNLEVGQRKETLVRIYFHIL